MKLNLFEKRSVTWFFFGQVIINQEDIEEEGEEYLYRLTKED